jgi:hypothetical protein
MSKVAPVMSGTGSAFRKVCSRHPVVVIVLGLYALLDTSMLSYTQDLSG